MKSFLALSVVLASSVSALAADAAITGKITISPELKSKISKTAVIYVIARPAGTAGGPPVAVQRIVQPFQFPVQFSLDQKNAMMPDAAFKGKFSVSARLSQSGSATPVGPNDLQTPKAIDGVEPGSKPISLELTAIGK